MDDVVWRLNPALGVQWSMSQNKAMYLYYTSHYSIVSYWFCHFKGHTAEFVFGRCSQRWQGAFCSRRLALCSAESMEGRKVWDFYNMATGLPLLVNDFYKRLKHAITDLCLWVPHNNVKDLLKSCKQVLLQQQTHNIYQNRLLNVIKSELFCL